MPGAHKFVANPSPRTLSRWPPSPEPEAMDILSMCALRAAGSSTASADIASAIAIARRSCTPGKILLFSEMRVVLWAARYSGVEFYFRMPMFLDVENYARLSSK